MPDDSTSVQQLRDAVAEFVRERDWERFHDPKNLAMSISIEAAELMEHFQWSRSEEVSSRLQNPATRSEVTDELADVLCYVLSLANALELDLSDAVHAKMVKNAAKYPAERFHGKFEE